jgi:hypothetical protein
MGELVGFVLLDNTKFLTNFTHYLFYLPIYGFNEFTNYSDFILIRKSIGFD